MKQFILVFVVSSQLFAQFNLEAARELRRTTEISAQSAEWSAEGDTIQVEVGKILAQGNTSFCWAFAGFHALRAFYANVEMADPKWRDFLNSLDTAAKLKAYILKQVPSTEIGGWPNEIVYFFEKTIGAPPEEGPWVSYVPSTKLSGFHPHPEPDTHPYTPKAYFTTLEKIVHTIRISLLKGAGVAYCTSQHCVTIYGGKYDGTMPLQYWIADSATGGSYVASADKYHQKMADITTHFRD